MATVKITEDATEQLAGLPKPIKARVICIIRRLERWPTVSGAKSLRGDLAGQFRIRTGDYRVQFTVKGDDLVIIGKIGHRDGFYDER